MNGATPSHEKIAQRAYAKWEEQGCPEGRAEQHWREAEAELRGTGEPSAAKVHPDVPTDHAETLAGCAGGGAPISNLDRALPPNERRRVRGERQHASGAVAEAPAPTSEAPHFVVVLDSAHVRIFRAEDTFGPSRMQLKLEQSIDLPMGKRPYTSAESDQAGQFPGLRGTPGDVAAHAGGSIDERLPMQEERDRRVIDELAARVGRFLRQYPEARWDYAAPPELHRHVLDRLGTDTLDRLGTALPKNLVNQPLLEICEHFSAPASGR